MLRLGSLLVISIALVALAVGALAAPRARVAPRPRSVVLFSDPGDWIDNGRPQLFDDTNAKIRIQQFDPGAISVRVWQGVYKDNYWLTFTVPKGQKLKRGVYAKAIRPRGGDAGLDISGGSRGCNEVSGLFQILDIGRSPAGVVNRLWVVFEQHCEKSRKALFGEVRIGEPRPRDIATVEPWTVRWPADDVSHPATVVPVTLRAFNVPVRVTRVSISGPGARDYEIRADDCTGRRLRRATCQVWVGLVPAGAGVRRASLTFVDSTGRRRHALLEDAAFGGRTEASMVSEPGDPVGQGKSFAYAASRDDLAAQGDRERALFDVVGADGHEWFGYFVSPPGQLLKPGTTYSNASYPPSGGPAMYVAMDDHRCYEDSGRFTVDSATWWPDGSLRTFGVEFEQRCQNATGVLRGSFAWRAGDSTPLPPWMRERRGRRTGPPYTVPRVVGLQLRKARSALGRANCRVGRLTWRRAPVRYGRVLAQSPRAGRHFAIPTRVNLVVSRGRR